MIPASSQEIKVDLSGLERTKRMVLLCPVRTHSGLLTVDFSPFDSGRDQMNKLLLSIDAEMTNWSSIPAKQQA